MTWLKRLVAVVVLGLVLPGCNGPTTALINLSLKGTLVPDELRVSVFGAAETLAADVRFANPTLPGRVVIQLPARDQPIRLYFEARKDGGILAQATGTLQSRAGHQVTIGVVLDADALLPDLDGDKVPDLLDNCVGVPNADQKDQDQDGIGDLCEAGADLAGLDLPTFELPPDLTTTGDLGDGGAPPGDLSVPVGDLGGAPILYSVAPATAAGGQTVVLEGRFGGAIDVVFSGSAPVAATVMSPTRARVTVPVGSTTGTVSVQSAAGASNELPFRRTTFGLGLNFWRSDYEQTLYARRMPSLLVPRSSFGLVNSGTHVYLIGGAGASPALASIESGLLNLDGSLDELTLSSNTLNTPRAAPSTVQIGSAVYVLGGKDGSGTALSSIERATLDSGGRLSAFTSLSLTMAEAHSDAAAVVVGTSLYVLGGAGSTTIERCTLVDDMLGGCAKVGDLPAGDYAGAQAAVLRDRVYLLGFGSTQVLRADIDATGTLGAFTVDGAVALGKARRAPAIAQYGNALYVYGGEVLSTVQTDGERALVNSATGYLEAFSAVAQHDYIYRRKAHRMSVIGNYVYAFGGYHLDHLRYVERANVNGSTNGSPLAAFADAPSALVIPRDDPMVVAVGSTLYVIGGRNLWGQGIASIERASLGSDGRLGAFALDAQSLPEDVVHGVAARLGPYVYIFGGDRNAGLSQKTFRARVTETGMEAWEELTGPSAPVLLEGRALMTATVSTSTLYVAGGWGDLVGSEHGRTTVDRADITVDGDVGPFSKAAELRTKRFAHGAAFTGNYLHVFGGFNDQGNGVEVIERCLINGTDVGCPVPDMGTAPLFDESSVTSPTRPTNAQRASVLVGASRLALLGGFYNTSVMTVGVKIDGSLESTFTNVTPLPTERYRHFAIEALNFACLVGGGTNSNEVGDMIIGGPVAALSCANFQ